MARVMATIRMNCFKPMMARAMATIRTNRFELKMAGLSNLKFELQTDKSYCITEGQPWEGISKIECSSDGCTLFVEAGRKKSKQVADWFIKTIESGSAIGCDSYDTLPDELNFAFIGTMSFDHRGNTYTGKDIVIAQGSRVWSRNNWWIGGPNMSTFAIVGPGITGIAGQNFTGKLKIPAKVTFTTSIGEAYTVKVGVIGISL